MSSPAGIRARFKLDYPGFAFDVDLELPGRGVTAVFGPSGSGKTTLLRCVAGLLRVPAGHLTVNGETWQEGSHFQPTHRRPLGYVFQEASLFPHLTVRGNLDYGMKRVPVAERKVSLDRAIGLLGIGHLLDRKPEGLSGGERQRVAIARALLTSPRLLLLDEPLAALDLARKQEILPYLERLHDELEIPVLYVSHAPDEVARLADHLVVLEAGGAVAAGPMVETLARLDLPIRLGEDAGVVLEGTIAERDERWQLARVDCSGTDFWVREGGHAPGHAVRVRILARDVSIALNRATDSSILNIIPAEVIELREEAHPAQVLVKLKLGATPVLARVTRRSVDALGLVPGRQVYAQIKAVALIA
ncbi:molybdenum ABC transporter ATP-binding protein [Sulfurisoma sediminicola]|uniref:Molybdate transport system ATP-binding protein n=1 Tax=Sulfurisoma sediminicola TaxID=1381557 RepID=A0A497XH56_9PROT|nr:molybdenum ABC transporter ATP-binding protein [Sulfurisoma sediminicola]RLJ65327.1 molybdate transport system ATP-binding protein [Sulfurisoma sediminicola]